MFIVYSLNKNHKACSGGIEMTYEDLLDKYVNGDTLQLLFDAKVCDSIQFFEASITKLQFAKIECQAIFNLEKVLQTDNEAWRRELFTKKYATNFKVVDVDYFSIKLDYKIIKQKLVYNFFHYLHGLFDTSAQFINKSLLADKQKKIDDVSMKSIKKELSKFPEFVSIHNFIEETMNEQDFQYIEDFNNINKHQYSLELFTSISINDGTIDSQIPSFEKKENKHDVVDLNKKIDQSLNYAINYVHSLCEQVFAYIKTHQSSYNKFRYHSVINHIQKSRSNNTTLEGSNTFLVTDDIFQIGDIVGIMLVSNDDQRYKFRNITSESIFIKNTNEQEIGMLSVIEPIKNNNDKYELFEYRKYKVQKLGDVEKELVLNFFKKPKQIQGNFKQDIIIWVD
jgi:hypothetical protein